MPLVQGPQFKNYCWMKNLWTFSWSGHTIVYSQHYTRVLIAPHLHQPLVCHSLVKASGGRQWHPTPVLLPGKSHGWRSLAAVHGVARSQTWLNDFTFTFHFQALEKEMAAHSGVLAWRIPGTGKPVGLPSMGSHRVGHDWSDLAAAAAVVEGKVKWLFGWFPIKIWWYL